MRRPRRGLFLSDLHFGSKYGLWWPDMEQKDGQHDFADPLPMNPVNTKIKGHWDIMLKVIARLNIDFVVWNGDLIEGMQDRSHGRGLITRSVDTQCLAARKAIQSVRDILPDASFYFTGGTEYHEKSNGEDAERSLANDFDSEFGDELIIEECGIRVFARHIISSSSSTWQYEATAPGRDHMLLFLNKSEDRYGPIDIAVFSHRHRFVNVQFSSGWALVTPGWQAKTPYASRKRGLTGIPEIGWVIAEIYGPRQILFDTRGIAPVVKPCRVVRRKSPQ